MPRPEPRAEAVRPRSKAGGKPVKTRRRKTVKLKPRRALKAAPRRSSSTAGVETDVTRLTRELNEALDQQAATSEVLEVISGSPGDLRRVFASMLEKATRLCQAEYGNLFLRTDNEDEFRYAAMHGLPSSYTDWGKREPLVRMRDHPHAPLARVAQTRKVLHIVDLAKDRSYVEREPRIVALVEAAGAHTIVTVPMLKEHELVGGLALYRGEVRPFTNKQIELVKNFALQAVIAIENARLLNELRQRTADLTESLEQQTATSEVLQVISSSPGDLQPVFDSMLENAVRICDAKFGHIYRWDGDALHLVATRNIPAAFADFRQRSPFRPSPENPIGRMVASKTVVHVADLAAEQRYIERRDPAIIAAVELAGIRTFVAVPMLKENELVGSFTIFRQEVRPFTDKHIALVTSFASQAVIAIENTRLLNELRESLQQQTATADVLKVISRSTFDLQTVLQTLVESAARLCEADKATITRQRGEVFFRAEAYGFSSEFLDYVRSVPVVPERGSALGRALLEGKVVHIPDVQADPEYTFVEAQRLGDFRTVLGAPMLREGIPIGVLALTRSEVMPFTDKQIELVSTFADQAAIAIENVRLFDDVQKRTDELTEALEQQTATSEVLRVISSSPGDLEPVRDKMLENAVRICDAKFGDVYRWEGDALRLLATHKTPPALVEELRRLPYPRPSAAGPVHRMAATKSVVHLSDLAEE